MGNQFGFQKSFYDWCIENNHEDYLKLWDYSLNKDTPKDLGCGSHSYRYFKCKEHKHESELWGIKRITSKNTIIDCKQCNSFYEWCINNNSKHLLELWDYELNEKSPKQVYKSGRDFCYFKCERGLHKSELWKLDGITSQHNKVSCRECNSFKQWCLDNNHQDWLELWDYNLNDVRPEDVCKYSGNRIYFKCPHNIHESTQFRISEITAKSYNLICKKCNSIAQYLLSTYGDNALNLYWNYSKNKNLNPYNVSRGSNINVWINCFNKNYHGTYKTTPANIIRKTGCPYCSGRKIHKFDSVGYKYPNILDIWSNKNDKSPYEYLPQCQESIWLKCKDGKHDEYNQRLCYSVNIEFKCPYCTRERNESYLQEKVRKHIESYGYTIKHERDCTILPRQPKSKQPMPYDNEILELKLLIETQGLQHYKSDCYSGDSLFNDNKTTPEQQLHKRKLYDRYKRFVAFCNGFYYLEIPYWTEKDESYKKLIDDKIKEIKEIQKSKQIAV